jgi:uncharacterized repeat protein (TIGR03837 family)
MIPSLTWDIFCKVIDNHGDIGVCWRLACSLAERGQRVRLWVDDASALAWMAPGAAAGPQPPPGATIEVRPWTTPLELSGVTPGDFLVEAFGCEVATEFIANYVISTKGNSQKIHQNRHWINLEYLSAEPYAKRNHGLPSPVLSGPGAGQTKHFFYPSFTLGTGGLLRESDLGERWAAFNRQAWRDTLGGTIGTEQGTGPAPASANSAPAPQAGVSDLLQISLFCYEPAALGDLLQQLAQGPQPARLLVTPGRAAAAVNNALQAGLPASSPGQSGCHPSPNNLGQLSILYLPYFSQAGYDELLWASDLNFVRGEDSLVRALWAGQPFIWHIYPQHDGAHATKLEAFLDWLGADASLRQFHRVWNGLAPGPLPALDLPAWRPIAHTAREKLLQQADLTTQLLNFVTPQPHGESKKR